MLPLKLQHVIPDMWLRRLRPCLPPMTTAVTGIMREHDARMFGEQRTFAEILTEKLCKPVRLVVMLRSHTACIQ